MSLNDWVEALLRASAPTCCRSEVVASIFAQSAELPGEFTSHIALQMAQHLRRDVGSIAVELHDGLPPELRARTEIVRGYLNFSVPTYQRSFEILAEVVLPRRVHIEVALPTSEEMRPQTLRLLGRALLFLHRAALKGCDSSLGFGVECIPVLGGGEEAIKVLRCALEMQLAADDTEIRTVALARIADISVNHPDKDPTFCAVWCAPRAFSNQNFKPFIGAAGALGIRVWVPDALWSDVPAFESRPLEWSVEEQKCLLAYLGGEVLADGVDYEVPRFTERANTRWWWAQTRRRIEAVLPNPTGDLHRNNQEAKYVPENLTTRYSKEMASYWCRLEQSWCDTLRSGSLTVSLGLERSLCLAVHRFLNYSLGRYSEPDRSLLRSVFLMLEADRYL